MDCEETRAALSAAEGGPAHAEAEVHLTSCSACRAWSLALDQLPARLAEWTAPEPSEDFDRRVLDRVRQERRPWRWAAVAAQIAIFALGALAGAAGARWMRTPPPAPVAVEPSLDLTDEYLAVR